MAMAMQPGHCRRGQRGSQALWLGRLLRCQAALVPMPCAGACKYGAFINLVLGSAQQVGMELEAVAHTRGTCVMLTH
jgi:hypothetical protein